MKSAETAVIREWLCRQGICWTIAKRLSRANISSHTQKQKKNYWEWRFLCRLCRYKIGASSPLANVNWTKEIVIFIIRLGSIRCFKHNENESSNICNALKIYHLSFLTSKCIA
jgi:hypothetical protein